MPKISDRGVGAPFYADKPAAPAKEAQLAPRKAVPIAASKAPRRTAAAVAQPSAAPNATAGVAPPESHFFKKGDQHGFVGGSRAYQEWVPHVVCEDVEYCYPSEGCSFDDDCQTEDCYETTECTDRGHYETRYDAALKDRIAACIRPYAGEAVNASERTAWASESLPLLRQDQGLVLGTTDDPYNLLKPAALGCFDGNGSWSGNVTPPGGGAAPQGSGAARHYDASVGSLILGFWLVKFVYNNTFLRHVFGSSKK